MADIPIIPPPSHPDEPPFVCIKINTHWIPYIIGLLRPAKFPEYWGGTLDENRNARRDVQNLIDQFQEMGECGEMDICCEPQIYIYRTNPDTGRPERSSDGGGVWTPDPADPAHFIHLNPPIVRSTVNATKCDAATNALEHIEDIITVQSENIGTAVTVLELSAAVCAFLLEVLIIIISGGAASVPGAAIMTAIWAAAAAALTEGKTAFDDYWTNDAKDKILCALYCNIGDNGQFTAVQYEAFKHKVRIDLPPSGALDFAMTAINAGGFVGMNQMCSYGSAAGADCAACTDCSECTTIWDIYTPGETDIGAIVARDAVAGTIDIESTLPDSHGVYYVIIKTPNKDACCDLLMWTPNPTGATAGGPAWHTCGEPQTQDDLHTGLFTSGCVNHLLFNSDAPFQLRLQFVDCA